MCCACFPIRVGFLVIAILGLLEVIWRIVGVVQILEVGVANIGLIGAVMIIILLVGASIVVFTYKPAIDTVEERKKFVTASFLFIVADVISILLSILSIALLPASYQDIFIAQFIGYLVGYAISLILHIWWMCSAQQFVRAKGQPGAVDQRYNQEYAQNTQQLL